ncbi:hypothetical protein [Oryzihumus sp.]
MLVLVPLPALVLGLLLLPRGSGSADPTTVRLGFGLVAGRALLVPMPSMSQMMMPMAEGGQHGDEVQVTLQLRNDSDSVVRVPFSRVRMVGAAGTDVVPSEGLQGVLVLRPHAAVEERLRFPAPSAARVRIRVPDGPEDRLLTLPVTR